MRMAELEQQAGTVHWTMQLRIARLCLDCEELHEAQPCPVCASESFAYISRWVPAPERRRQPRPRTSADADTYAQMLHPSRGSSLRRKVVGGVAGMTALSIAGWLWQRWKATPSESTTSEAG
jgi:hypothetical protein